MVRQRWSSLQDVRIIGVFGWLWSPSRTRATWAPLLRSCDAAGGRGIILLEQSTDPYHPSSVRASTGAVFTQKLVKSDLKSFRLWKEKTAYSVIGTYCGDVRNYRDYNYPEDMILLMGSEQKGLQEDAPGSVRRTGDHSDGRYGGFTQYFRGCVNCAVRDLVPEGKQSMIASIKGEVIAKEDNSLIVQNAGIGLRVFVPVPLRASAELNHPIMLFTYLVVREDNLSLYGFEKAEERDLFNELVKVSGIGPRIALSILSTLPVPMIYQAVIKEKPEIFSRVPGIGSKTAQKMILYLHDKLKAEYGAEELAGIQNVEVELIDALTGLGYSVVEAQAAIQSIPKDAPEDIEERLRLALQYFTS